MALADALTAFGEYIGDVLVNECGREVPDRVLRYQGHAVPDDVECAPNGTLSVWWEPPMRAKTPCSGPLLVTLGARWVVCWKMPNYTANTVELFDTEWDATAAVIADTAECVARALMRLPCADTPGSAKAAALLSHVVATNLSVAQVRPVGPLGGVAGAVWMIDLALRAAPST